MPFNRFLAFGSYVFDILVLYRVYFSTCSPMFIVWVLPIWRRSGFKKLDSKTIGCSIQSFFEISGLCVEAVKATDLEKKDWIEQPIVLRIQLFETKSAPYW